MNEYAIEVDNLVKRFGDFVAVNNISFSVKKGEIFGFLGPNGAGKTTTIRMLCGIMDPTSGKGRVGGFDIATQREQIKKIIGYMSQKFSLYEDLTVKENIDFYAGIYQTKKETREQRKEDLIKRAELFGCENQLTVNLASSLKQHLALSCSIVHDPQIVFLDEPTAGVDPLSRKKFWRIIKDLSARGVTSLVTTHYMDEVEHCDRLALIHDGKIIACDSPSRLKEQVMKGILLEIECDRVMEGLEILRNVPEIFDVALYGLFLHVVVPSEEIIRNVREALSNKNIVLRRIEKISPSLEDVFVSLIEEQERQKVRTGLK